MLLTRYFGYKYWLMPLVIYNVGEKKSLFDIFSLICDISTQSYITVEIYRTRNSTVERFYPHKFQENF
jgi:hypothetical protein